MRHVLFFLFCIGNVSVLTAAEWRSTAASTFLFATTFEGETLAGEFTEFQVVLNFEEGAPDATSLVVTVDLTAADLGDPDMNDVLMDAAWFDAENVGDAMYSSSAVREVSPGAYLATGVLRLKGIQRSVEVPFEWQSDGRAASLRGHLSLRRTDFDIGTGEWATDDAIGLNVKLKFNVKFERSE